MIAAEEFLSIFTTLIFPLRGFHRSEACAVLTMILLPNSRRTVPPGLQRIVGPNTSTDFFKAPSPSYTRIMHFTVLADAFPQVGIAVAYSRHDSTIWSNRTSAYSMPKLSVSIFAVVSLRFSLNSLSSNSLAFLPNTGASLSFNTSSPAVELQGLRYRETVDYLFPQIRSPVRENMSMMVPGLDEATSSCRA